MLRALVVWRKYEFEREKQEQFCVLHLLERYSGVETITLLSLRPYRTHTNTTFVDLDGGRSVKRICVHLLVLFSIGSMSNAQSDGGNRDASDGDDESKWNACLDTINMCRLSTVDREHCVCICENGPHLVHAPLGFWVRINLLNFFRLFCRNHLHLIEMQMSARAELLIIGT